MPSCTLVQPDACLVHQNSCRKQATPQICWDAVPPRIGPACAVNHLLECDDRNGVRGPEFTRPVVIQNDVWVGGGAIICPGARDVGAGTPLPHGLIPRRPCACA